MDRLDLIVIGGGIVGLATAYRYCEKFPGRKVCVLEKENAVAQHQTGRNSGVLHSGIYYKPGSLKARNCLEGKQALEAFCQAEAIAVDRCGKVIVATREQELPSLKWIEQRGAANGVACEQIGIERLAELEPHVAGIAALHVPSTSIVDFVAVAERLAERVEQSGGRVVTQARVTSVQDRGDEVIVTTTADELVATQIANCAGLHCDTIAQLAGARPAARIVPFRGEYFQLTDDAKHLVRNLIYPLPDPQFPFLGVHFTRMITGPRYGEKTVECGPNAVLAMAKEGYAKTTVHPSELLASLTYPGFLKLARKHWRMGAGELWRSINKRAFVKKLQRLIPAIQAEHLISAPAGVRAQAVLPDGTLVDDFLIERTNRIVHVLNAPSPAATASLRIADQVVDCLAS